ncbi:uncharacterized protein LOC128892331 [Hylaeus anthracinus]|uniref:uncharacterized protein LOC128892331 n=1 Tax=Hylaeus anthracinus TaxID=313031 RepID=UPI0023B9FBF8|nr:uncharacterized protein LOC128892331 [Hylaeus anthracinus]
MCIFTNLVITKTIRYGLKTKYFVECQMCRFKDNFWSEPTDDNILDINRDAVYGTLLTGTGHTQLEELLAAIDVPCMSNKTYLKYESEVYKAFADAAEEEMRFAGEAEKQLAIARGDLINGIPHIPVVTDGSWMKKSYRGGGYDSPSGSAFIVGYYTRKILFVDFPPYPNLVVKKIECINHLLRNLANKIRDAGNGASYLKAIVSSSDSKIRNAVVKAVTYRRNSQVSWERKIAGLMKDLQNIPSHVFGEHKDCA